LTSKKSVNNPDATKAAHAEIYCRKLFMGSHYALQVLITEKLKSYVAAMMKFSGC